MYHIVVIILFDQEKLLNKIVIREINISLNILIITMVNPLHISCEGKLVHNKLCI